MALFIEITAADGLVSRTRLEPGNNRFTVRLGDSYRIFDDQTGVTPEGVAVKRVDNSLVVDGLDTAQGNIAPTTVEFPEFYSVCSAGSPCTLTVDSGPQSAPVTVTPGTQPIGALSDGSFVLYDRDFAETAPAAPSLADSTSLKYAVYGLGGAAVLGLAAGGGGGGGDGGGGGGGPDGTLKLTSSHFVNSRTPLITGEAQPGARITVRIDTDGDNIPNVTYTTTAGPDFKWAVNLASAPPESGALPPGGLPDASNVSITATTDQGNSSLPVFVLAYDGVPPAPAVLAAVATDNVVNAAEKSSGVAVAGTAEPGATVIVNWGAQVRTAVVDANGNWQTTPFDSASIPGDGSSTISAVVQDLAGNNSPATEASVTVNTAPARLDNLSGVGDINASMAATGFSISGRTDPNGTVALNWHGIAKGPVTADGNGEWSIPIAAAEIPQVPSGSVSYQIAASNVIGNTNAVGGQVAIDTVPPTVISIAPVTGDNVVTLADNPASGITVNGSVNEGNSSVNVTWGGQTAQGTADAAGNWAVTFGPGNLPPTGSHAVTVVATDGAGNASAPLGSPLVVVDVTPPPLTIAPVAVDNIVNLAESLGGVAFSGSTEAGAVVSVTWGGATLTVVADGAGGWITSPFSVAPNPGAVVQATVVATDALGNPTQQFHDVTVDTVAPSPAVGTVVDVDNVVNVGQLFAVTGGPGSVEAGSSVTVAIGANTVSAVVAADGSWTTGPTAFLAVGLPGMGDLATVTVSDAAQNATPIAVPFTYALIGATEPPDAIAIASLTTDAVASDVVSITQAITADAGLSTAATMSSLVPLEPTP